MQEIFDKMRQVFDGHSYQTGDNADNHTQNRHIIFVAHMTVAPFVETVEPMIDFLFDSGGIHSSVASRFKGTRSPASKKRQST